MTKQRSFHRNQTVNTEVFHPPRLWSLSFTVLVEEPDILLKGSQSSSLERLHVKPSYIWGRPKFLNETQGMWSENIEILRDLQTIFYAFKFSISHLQSETYNSPSGFSRNSWKLNHFECRPTCYSVIPLGCMQSHIGSQFQPPENGRWFSVSFTKCMHNYHHTTDYSYRVPVIQT